jgi:molybdopterin converting factor small subunit
MLFKTLDIGKFAVSRNGKPAKRLELRNLAPSPQERWALLRRFLDLNQSDLEAMAATVEILMRRAPEFVESTYDYLAAFPETASILGWEHGAAAAHLEERRRFFTIWLARTLGLDLSDDMANYLFRAGNMHAGHGPRAIHSPEIFVTGSISLTQAAFARYLNDGLDDVASVTRALAGWNKLLSMHLDLMLTGYRAARELDKGQEKVTVSVYNKLQPLLGVKAFEVGIGSQTTVADVLCRAVNYYPQMQPALLDAHWETPPSLDADTAATWLEDLERVYRVRPSWTILHNHINLRWGQGLQAQVKAGDTIAIFPPTR